MSVASPAYPNGLASPVNLSHGIDASSRRELIHRIVDLFVHTTNQGDESKVLYFDEAMSLLAATLATDTRREVSERLADLQIAPPNFLVKLAHDEIQVADPVLRRSHALKTETLVDVANKQGQAHLFSIANRTTLSTTITDALVEKGDATVLQQIATNSGAQLSQRGWDLLIEKAKDNEELQAQIAQRLDIPTASLAQLLETSSDTVRTELIALHGDKDPDEIAKLFDLRLEARGEEADITRPALQNAFVKAKQLMMQKLLNENHIKNVAAQESPDDLIGALAVMCRLELKEAELLIMQTRYDPLLVISRAFGFSEETFQLVMKAGPRGAKLSTQRKQEALSQYRKITAQTAQRIFRFWRVRNEMPWMVEN